MIKFFRKTRQNMIKENRTSKYILYAIGEIVLVVIGILIAVQINSWNNNRKLMTDNKIFLEKMIIELELNKTRMKLLTEVGFGDRYISLEQAVKNCDSLLKLTYKGLNESDLGFILNNRFDAGGTKLNLHNGVYEELINTGKLYTIGSDSLIINIKNYYKRAERETGYNIENTKGMYDGFDLMKKGLWKLRLDYYMDSINFNIKDYPWFFDISSDHYQNIQIGITDMLSGQSNNSYKMKEIVKYSDSLIYTIKKELKSTN
jgi:Family of unknown function (DUF6090)